MRARHRLRSGAAARLGGGAGVAGCRWRRRRRCGGRALVQRRHGSSRRRDLRDRGRRFRQPLLPGVLTTHHRLLGPHVSPASGHPRCRWTPPRPDDRNRHHHHHQPPNAKSIYAPDGPFTLPDDTPNHPLTLTRIPFR